MCYSSESEETNNNGRRTYLRTASTLLGVCLMLAPNGLYLVWGNLSIYTMSYFLAADTPRSEINSAWLMSLYHTAWTIMIPIGGYLGSIIGRRATILLGAVIYNASIAVCYGVLDTSVPVFTVVLGIGAGAGSGLSHGLLMKVVMECTDRYVGIFSAIVESSMNIGAALTNQFVTMYINPHYLTADWSVDPDNYFSQVQVVRRVPSAYLIMGFMFAIIHLLGFILIFPHTPNFKKPIISDTSYGSVFVHDDNDHPLPEKTTRRLVDKVDHPSAELSTMQAVKKLLASKKFYALLFSSFLNEWSVLVIFSFYKQFGRSAIRNENLLTLIGSISIVVITVISLAYGAVLDRFGVKNTFISLFALLSVSSCFYVLTPATSEYLYLLLTVLVMGCISAFDDLIGPAVLCVFGHAHFITACGMVWSSSFIVNVCSPPLVEMILNRMGWGVLFNSLGIINALGLIAIVLFL